MRNEEEQERELEREGRRASEQRHKELLFKLEPTNAKLIERFLDNYPKRLAQCKGFFEEAAEIKEVLASGEYAKSTVLTKTLSYDLRVARFRCNQYYGLNSEEID